MPASVVIVGGGFAGVSLAKALDARKDASVTLVSDRDFFYIKYGGLRAAAMGGAWVDRSQIALTDIVKKGKVVVGKLASVNAAGKKITLENGTEIPYDVLVLATGSRARGVAEPANSAATRAEFKGFFDKTRAALASAKSIAIVGGGPIGFEFAGEVRAVVKPSTKVTLVAGKAGVFSAVQPPFKPGFYTAIQKKLADNNVVLVNENVTSPALDPTAPFVHPEGGKVTLESGRVIEADVVFFCVGVEVRTSMLPADWLDPATRQVVVEPTFQVRGQTNVFAVGDIAKTGRTKLGYLATSDTGVVLPNVLAVLKGAKPAKKYNPVSPPMMIVPFGPRQGVSQMPWGVSGDYLSSLIKGKGLFENMTSKQLTGKPAVKADVPPAPA